MNELRQHGEIKNRIFNVRGKEVMVDRDLAELYEIKATRNNFV